MISLYRTLFVFFIIGIVVFAVARVGYLSYAEIPLQNAWPALGMGLRFDLKVLAILSLFIMLLAGMSTLHKKIAKGFQSIAPFIFAGFTTLLVFFAVANYFYLHTYNHYIDVFAFGLFDGNTTAILKSVWADYPVLGMLAGLMAVFLMARYGYKKILSLAKKPFSMLPSVTGAFVVLVLLLVLARGSLGVFPLHQDEAQVAGNPLINASVPNGIVALFWANQDRQKSQIIPFVTEAEGRILFSQFFGKAAKKDQPIFEQFFTKTPKNDFLAAHPPHVFLGIMESMSTHLLSLHEPSKTNLTGALQPHLDTDFLFTRFVSSGNGTEPSLAHLLFSSPLAGISHSRYQRIKLATSIAKPYKEAGYKTVFVTVGRGSWKNLGRYLLGQYFDEVVDKTTIKTWFPEAESQTWGLYDEWGFKAVEKIFKTATQPVFVVFLSITNHPPFETPDDYQPYPIVLNPAQKQILKGFPSPKLALTSFQYANDVLGKFMTRIKQSRLGDKTILAFTGDHNARSIAQVDEKNKAYYYGVPFLISIPKQYQKNVVYDNLRVGSHKDIAPTLYHASLSEAHYINLGKSMLRPLQIPHEFGVNKKVSISQQGLYDVKLKKQWAWQGKSMYLEGTLQKNKELEKQTAVFFRLENWVNNWQLHHE